MLRKLFTSLRNWAKSNIHQDRDPHQDQHLHPHHQLLTPRQSWNRRCSKGSQDRRRRDRRRPH